MEKKFLLLCVVFTISMIYAQIKGTTISIFPPLSDLTPPAITHASLNDSVYFKGPFDIYAVITDSSGIDTVFLIYSRNSAPADTLGMLHLAGNLYWARIDTIPSFSIGDHICYSIVAWDDSPNHNYKKVPTSGCYQSTIYTSALPSGCTTPLSTFPLLEDFETALAGNGNYNNPGTLPGGWTRIPESTVAIYKVMVKSGTTPSYDTGPEGDHTSGSGNYVYAEASNGNQGNIAQLISPCLDITQMAYPYLEFWYHMYGLDIGSLSVDIWYGNVWINNVYTLTAQQQLSNSDPWRNVRISLYDFKSITQVRFRFIRGSSLNGDIALDDIKFWEPSTNDAGIASIDYPLSSTTIGMKPVKVSLANYGLNNSSSATINWMIDNNLQTPYYWTGFLPPADTVDSLQIGTYNFTAGYSNITAWTSMPNNVVDTNTQNDTSSLTSFICNGPLGGIYTVGGTAANFADFDLVLLALYNCGIDSQVIFKINPGIYTKQLRFTGIINGGSETNTITFESATGLKTDVTIQYATSAAENWVLELNGAAYYKFKNLTIQSTTSIASYGTVVSITNGSHHNTFEGCIINSVQTTSGFSYPIQIHTGLNQYNSIINNDLRYGIGGIRNDGQSSTILCKGNTFLNNRITDFSSRGIYCTDQDSLSVIGNYIENGISSSGAHGIYANTCNNIKFLKNHVHINSTTSSCYGMVFYLCNGSSTNHNLIANNFINLSGGYAITGINHDHGTYNDYCFNTVN